MTCKGACARLEGARAGVGARYSGGRAFCTRCQCSFMHEGKYCPCCGSTRRKRSHNNVQRRGRVMEAPRI